MKNIVIVGAGIAGLSAGIYAQKSGFNVTIFESHTIPGGNCTSWRRNGYLFEGGMHWLTGSATGLPLNEIWRETGAILESSIIINGDPFAVFEIDGKRAALYRDADKLRSHFVEISPEDSNAINILYKDICRFKNIGMPISDVSGVKTKKKLPPMWKALLKMLPVIPRMSSLNKISISEYVSQFKNQLIRQLLASMVPSDMSAASLLFTLATFASGDGGYVEGGSLAMADNMAKRFKELGGEIKYRKRIEQVVIKDNKADGVLINNEFIQADAVIIASDTLIAIDKLFKTPLTDQWAVNMRSSTQGIACTFICMGVEDDLSNFPEKLAFNLNRPFNYAGKQIKELGFNQYTSYKGYSPNGCTSVTMVLMGDTYDYWKDLREKDLYQKGKQELFNDIKERLEEQYPIFKNKIKVWDIATPLTYERYCGTYRGSWMTNTPPGSRPASYPVKSKNIRNIYFAGQRLLPPGGMPGAVITGRTAAQYLCKDFNAEFVS
jgi:phytoene dehydrogenase-like protein